MQVFSNLVRMVQNVQAELILAVEEKQRKTVRRAQGLIEELEQEIATLKTRNSEIDRLARTDDHIYFLQVESYSRKKERKKVDRLNKLTDFVKVIWLFS